jgi:predicted amidohydrolase YtcJ
MRMWNLTGRTLRRFAATAAAAGALGAVACSRPVTAEAPADLIVLNGKVYTALADAKPAGAVAVRGNTIVRVGSNQDVEPLRGPATQVVDAGGGSVLPGFNDSHVHFLGGGFGLEQVDLAGLLTLPEIQAKIRAFADAHPDDAWVRGRGWLYTPFPGGLPIREQLDAVVSDRPAIMSCYDGHSVWVNSKALALAGITKTTPIRRTGSSSRTPGPENRPAFSKNRPAG